MRAVPDCALDEAMVTTRPQLAATMSGAASWMQLNVPVRFTAITRSQISGVMSKMSSNDSMPARHHDGDRTELGANRGVCGFDRGTVRHIARHADGAAAVRVDLLGGLDGGIARPVE